MVAVAFSSPGITRGTIAQPAKSSFQRRQYRASYSIGPFSFSHLSSLSSLPSLHQLTPNALARQTPLRTSETLTSETLSSSVTTRRRTISVVAQAKGFGKKPDSAGKAKKGSSGGSGGSSSRVLEELGAVSVGESATNKGGTSATADVVACPCGGGKEKRGYKDCCGRYHGGVKEPDAATLMKARFSAFARGVIPYLVRTTHDEHPDIPAPGGPEGRKELAEDCEETCRRLVFKHLEILGAEAGEGEDEAFVSFRVVYAYKHGTTTENQILVEKSRFVRESESGGRWLYRERIPIDAASEASWKHGGFLQEQQRLLGEMAGRPKSYTAMGQAQPKMRPRSG